MLPREWAELWNENFEKWVSLCGIWRVDWNSWRPHNKNCAEIWGMSYWEFHNWNIQLLGGGQPKPGRRASPGHLRPARHNLPPNPPKKGKKKYMMGPSRLPGPRGGGQFAARQPQNWAQSRGARGPARGPPKFGKKMGNFLLQAWPSLLFHTLMTKIFTGLTFHRMKGKIFWLGPNKIKN